jgi:hypothetical protein
MTSLVGALAGAFAGATAAQRIAERTRQSDNLLGQLRATNAAMTVAFTICNSFIQLKRQHVQALYVGFHAQVAALQEFHRKRNAGEIPLEQPFQFQADLRSIQLPLMPVEVLQRLIFDRLSVSGRPLALAATIAGTVESVRDLMEKRAELVTRFNAIPPGHDALTIALYFGLPHGDGRVSTEYKDTLEGLFNQIENGIFFSELLCKDLKGFGDETLAKYKKLSKKTTERVSEVDFELARREGLMPDESKFADWLRGFAKAGNDETSSTKATSAR